MLILDLVFGVLAAGIGISILFGSLTGVFVALVGGMAFGLVRRSTEPTEPDEMVSPGGLLRSDRAVVLYAALIGGLFGVPGGAMLGVLNDDLGDRFLINSHGPLEVMVLSITVLIFLSSVGFGVIFLSTSAWEGSS